MHHNVSLFDGGDRLCARNVEHHGHRFVKESACNATVIAASTNAEPAQIPLCRVMPVSDLSKVHALLLQAELLHQLEKEVMRLLRGMSRYIHQPGFLTTAPGVADSQSRTAPLPRVDSVCDNDSIWQRVFL